MIHDLKPYPAMKDSGVEWLGDVPVHWDLVPNRALMRLRKEVVGDRSDDYILLSLTKQGIIARDMENPEGKFPASFDTYQVVEPGDLIFCLFDIDETPRTVGLSGLSGMITGAYTRFVCPDVSVRRFIYLLYLSLDNGKLLKPLYSGLRKVIQKSTFLSAKVALPPFPEQAAIVRYLDYVDRRIRRYIQAKQKLIVLLEEQKETIIHRAVTRGLDPDVPFKDSGVEWLGEVPEHWEVVKLRHFAKIGNGSTPSRSRTDYWSSGHHAWLNSSVVNRVRVDEADQFVTDVALKECHLPRLVPGDVLIAITGQGKTRGRSTVLAIEATINQHLAYVRLRISRMLPEYLQLVFTGAYAHLRSISDDSGSTKGALTCADIRHFKVPLPPPVEQHDILDWVQQENEASDLTINRARREIELLREYRTRLIADVVTGKLDVREAAAGLPDEPQEPEALHETDALGDADEETEIVENLEG